MKIGFTGTRKGMTELQKSEVRRILLEYSVRHDMEVHHGDCIGADTDFHNICISMWYPIFIHPSNLSTRAWNKGAIKVFEPKLPLVRDHDIVDSVNVLIATPRGLTEELRSGTWATVRYARKANVNRKVSIKVHIVLPF